MSDTTQTTEETTEETQPKTYSLLFPNLKRLVAKHPDLAERIIAVALRKKWITNSEGDELLLYALGLTEEVSQAE